MGAYKGGTAMIVEFAEELNVAISNGMEKSKHNEIKKLLIKLLPYGEIEEELDIDLIKVCKALKNGIVVRCDNEFSGERNVFVSLTPDRLSIEYKNKCLRKGKNKFYFTDYGKKWALTEDELL